MLEKNWSKKGTLKKSFAGSQRRFEGAVRAGLMSAKERGGQEGKKGAMLVEQRRELRGGGGGKCGERKVRQLSIKR